MISYFRNKLVRLAIGAVISGAVAAGAFGHGSPHGAATGGTATSVSKIEVDFSPGNSEGLVVKTIEGAQSEILVAAYSFTSKAVAQALVQAHKKGIKVMVVLDKSQRSEKYSGLTFLQNMGVPVRVNDRYAIMHNKFIVIDSRTVETGSFNYTSSAATRNAENVIVLHDAPEVAAIYRKEWTRLWNEAGA